MKYFLVKIVVTYDGLEFLNRFTWERENEPTTEETQNLAEELFTHADTEERIEVGGIAEILKEDYNVLRRFGI